MQAGQRIKYLQYILQADDAFGEQAPWRGKTTTLVAQNDELLNALGIRLAGRLQAYTNLGSQTGVVCFESNRGVNNDPELASS